MAGWLQNPFKTGPKAKSVERQAVARRQQTAPARPAPPLPAAANLPNATIIYGVGAALLFVAAFFLLLSGKWFSSIEVFAIGAVLMGYAVHLLKHQD